MSEELEDTQEVEPVSQVEVPTALPDVEPTVIEREPKLRTHCSRGHKLAVPGGPCVIGCE